MCVRVCVAVCVCVCVCNSVCVTVCVCVCALISIPMASYETIVTHFTLYYIYLIGNKQFIRKVYLPFSEATGLYGGGGWRGVLLFSTV